MGKDSLQETWIPLLEYSVKRGVSLSTLRRYIKAKKIPFKLEYGKYLIYDDGNISAASAHQNSYFSAVSTVHSASQENSLAQQITRLQSELQRAQEEIAELKMLVALYEEKSVHR